MTQKYTWQNFHNAIGWAAACTRCALAFYTGENTQILVSAIEIGEQCAGGKTVDKGTARTIAALAARTAAFSTTSEGMNAAEAASYLADIASGAPGTNYVELTASHAVKAGVSQSKVDALKAHWIARDLGAAPDTEQCNAVVALILADNITAAKALV